MRQSLTTSDILEGMVAGAFATLDPEGLLLSANTGFRRLISLDQASTAHCYVNRYFLQPTFTSIASYRPDNMGLVFSGLLTIGDPTELPRTLNSKIWWEDTYLHVFAEYDVASLEDLNTRILELNQAYTKSQFDLTQANLNLKQRELELKQSLAELEAANEHLRSMQKQLVEADKMAALGMMVAGIAHEINTPLGIGMGCSSLLEQQTVTLTQRFNERKMTQTDLKTFLNVAQEEIQLLNNNLKRIAKLTESFRQTSVASRQNTPVYFKIHDCLQDVVTSLHKPLQLKQIDLTIDCNSNLEIKSYLGDWASIFTNLITNSIRHGFKDPDQGTGNILVSINSTETRLIVDYTDDGIGLSSEAQKRIFEPFYTTDMQQGMGLGMHIIYNIITQQMHGTIACLTPDTHGIHVRIEVPQ